MYRKFIMTVGSTNTKDRNFFLVLTLLFTPFLGVCVFGWYHGSADVDDKLDILLAFLFITILIPLIINQLCLLELKNVVRDGNKLLLDLVMQVDESEWERYLDKIRNLHNNSDVSIDMDLLHPYHEYPYVNEGLISDITVYDGFKVRMKSLREYGGTYTDYKIVQNIGITLNVSDIPKLDNIVRIMSL